MQTQCQNLVLLPAGSSLDFIAFHVSVLASSGCSSERRMDLRPGFVSAPLAVFSVNMTRLIIGVYPPGMYMIDAWSVCAE